MIQEITMEQKNYNYDPSFSEESMYMQLGRILDSESARSVVPAHKFKPIETVVTDGGKSFKVKHREALLMREMIVKVPTVERGELLKRIQTPEGFKEFRDAIKQIMKGKK